MTPHMPHGTQSAAGATQMHWCKLARPRLYEKGCVLRRTTRLESDNCPCSPPATIADSNLSLLADLAGPLPSSLQASPLRPLVPSVSLGHTPRQLSQTAGGARSSPDHLRGLRTSRGGKGGIGPGSCCHVEYRPRGKRSAVRVVLVASMSLSSTTTTPPYPPPSSFNLLHPATRSTVHTAFTARPTSRTHRRSFAYPRPFEENNSNIISTQYPPITAPSRSAQSSTPTPSVPNYQQIRFPLRAHVARHRSFQSRPAANPQGRETLELAASSSPPITLAYPPHVGLRQRFSSPDIAIRRNSISTRNTGTRQDAKVSVVFVKRQQF